MSTKVYYGVRCKKEDLPAVLLALHSFARGLVTERVRWMSENINPGDTDACIKASTQIHLDWINRESSFWHISAWAQVWIPDGDYVLMNLSDSFKRKYFPPELTEYGYWNNVDQPDHVTDEEWQERGKVWESALSNVIDEAGQFVFDFISERDVWLEFYSTMMKDKL